MGALCYNNMAELKGDNLDSYAVNIVDGKNVLISTVNIDKDNVFTELWACIRIVRKSLKNRGASVYISYESDGLYYPYCFNYTKFFGREVSKSTLQRKTKRILKRIDKEKNKSYVVLNS